MNTYLGQACWFFSPVIMIRPSVFGILHFFARLAQFICTMLCHLSLLQVHVAQSQFKPAKNLARKRLFAQPENISHKHSFSQLTEALQITTNMVTATTPKEQAKALLAHEQAAQDLVDGVPPETDTEGELQNPHAGGYDTMCGVHIACSWC